MARLLMTPAEAMAATIPMATKAAPPSQGRFKARSNPSATSGTAATSASAEREAERSGRSRAGRDCREDEHRREARPLDVAAQEHKAPGDRESGHILQALPIRQPQRTPADPRQRHQAHQVGGVVMQADR